MLFSLKPSPLIDSLPSLTISSNRLQRVSSFHYLGITLTPSLSWSLHISNVRSKSRKVLGLIFRHFYRFSSPNTILRLYSSLVCPILENCSPVWSPNSVSTSNSLESIQSFALKLASKFHSPASSSLTLLSLSSRRLQARIKLLFAVTRNLYFLPSPMCFPRPVLSILSTPTTLLTCLRSSVEPPLSPDPSSPLLSRFGTGPSFKMAQSYSLLSRYYPPT